MHKKQNHNIIFIQRDMLAVNIFAGMILSSSELKVSNPAPNPLSSPSFLLL